MCIVVCMCCTDMGREQCSLLNCRVTCCLLHFLSRNCCQFFPVVSFCSVYTKIKNARLNYYFNSFLEALDDKRGMSGFDQLTWSNLCEKYVWLLFPVASRFGRFPVYIFDCMTAVLAIVEIGNKVKIVSRQCIISEVLHYEQRHAHLCLPSSHWYLRIN